MQKEKFLRYLTMMYIYDCTGSRVYKIKSLLLDRLLLIHSGKDNYGN